MIVSNYAYRIDSIVVYKFGSLISGALNKPDKVNSIDITAQVIEINIYESIFESVITAELAIVDHIGLFVNFPLSGEEAVFINYTNINDQRPVTLRFVIDSITDITVDDAARAVQYIIKLVAIENYANARQTVQQAYHDTMPNIAKQIFQQHIVERVQAVYPSYPPPVLITENNDMLAGTVVIPNINPFAAISMLGEMTVSSNNNQTYLFFQTNRTFHFVTLQGLYNSTRGSSRSNAVRNKYVYISNFSDQQDITKINQGRVVSNLVYNKRLSSFQKLAMGYFHNNHFEINIAQKAVWGQPTYVDQQNIGPTIETHPLNTDNYIQLAKVEGDEEQSNRTRYTVTTQKENDDNYPISRWRDKWGIDLIASTAFSQIDLTVTIPGTSQFSAGDLFYLEIPENHGFNQVKKDDLISGIFLITEIKQMLHIGGYHTTVLRINKDSYLDSIDRQSRYVQ